MLNEFEHRVEADLSPWGALAAGAVIADSAVPVKVAHRVAKRGTARAPRTYRKAAWPAGKALLFGLPVCALGAAIVASPQDFLLIVMPTVIGGAFLLWMLTTEVTLFDVAGITFTTGFLAFMITHAPITILASIGRVLIGLSVLAVLVAWLDIFLRAHADKRDHRSVHVVPDRDGVVGVAWAAARRAVDAAGSHDRAEVVATVRELMWEGRHDFELVVPQLTRLADATTRAAAARDAQQRAVESGIEEERSRHGAQHKRLAEERLSNIVDPAIQDLGDTTASTRAATDELFGVTGRFSG